MVREGEPAPDFTLRADTGEDVTLSSLKGSPVVLYFYPRDDTPGCTTQACSFRDAYAEFFEDDPPARVAIQAAGLPRGADVEIDAIVAL